MAAYMTHAQPFACPLAHVLDGEQYALGVVCWHGGQCILHSLGHCPQSSLAAHVVSMPAQASDPLAVMVKTPAARML